MNTMKINEKKFTIEVTKSFAQKASRVGSPEYYELLEVRHNFPKFKVVVNQTNMKAALEECMKECGVSRYEAAYMMAFDFYECAGFDTEVLEKELKSMSGETLIHHVLTEM